MAAVRRLFGLFGAGAIGAVVGVVVMMTTRGSSPSPSPSERPTSPGTTIPAKVAPLPESSGDVLLAWTPRELTPGLVEAARALPDVRVVSEVAGGLTDLVASQDSDGAEVDALDPGWAIPLDTVAIDPGSHAQFASIADREAVTSLAAGQALLGRTSADLRRLDVGGTIELAGGGKVVVGGIVEDTTIGAAELAVDAATGARLGVTTSRYLLISHGGDRATVEAALRRVLPPDGAIRFRGLGETPYLRNGDAVLPQVRIKERFGEFSYKAPPAGTREFLQEPGWQSENLVARDLPLLGQARCHRAVIDAVEGALTELEEANLGGLVDEAGFAGCWNPRLVVPGSDVSHHAWGVALDVNYDENPTGQESVQDPRLVEIFERWGFTWGGQWLVRDPAHFEFVRPPLT